jgi:hypothetical protein
MALFRNLGVKKMTIEEILREEIRLSKDQIEHGYKHYIAEDIAEGTADLKALKTLLIKCHQNNLLTDVTV